MFWPPLWCSGATRTHGHSCVMVLVVVKLWWHHVAEQNTSQVKIWEAVLTSHHPPDLAVIAHVGKPQNKQRVQLVSRTWVPEFKMCGGETDYRVHTSQLCLARPHEDGPIPSIHPTTRPVTLQKRNLFYAPGQAHLWTPINCYKAPANSSWDHFSYQTLPPQYGVNVEPLCCHNVEK